MKGKDLSIIALVILVAAILCLTMLTVHEILVSGPITINNSGVVEDNQSRSYFQSTTGSQHTSPSFRTITDMNGRTVTIPTNISKVIGSSTFVYVLAPDKLGAWQSQLSNKSRRFILEKYRNLPVISSTNYEAIISAHPDIVIIESDDLASTEIIQEKLGPVPLVSIRIARNATDYTRFLRFTGDLLGVPDRANETIDYYENVLNEVQTNVSAIPRSERMRVYYGWGADGLSTDPMGAMPYPHSQLIDVCGGINVARENKTDSTSTAMGSNITEILLANSGSLFVTKESVIKWNPDVIMTSDSTFSHNIYDDESWQHVTAVKNHRVHLTPTLPNNWFDRPPGINRIVGIPWTAHVLYPDLFSEEWFRSRVKEYYAVYYHYDNLSDEEISYLLY